jgi:hypothetical protein
MIDLEAIKARCKAATAGPWEVIGGEWEGQARVYVGRRTRENLLPKADADFIVTAHEDVPVLVAEVERLRESEGVASRIIDALINGENPRDSVQGWFQARWKTLGGEHVGS